MQRLFFSPVLIGYSFSALVKFVNFFKLWTRSKARAAQAVAAEADFCECGEKSNKERPSPIKKFVRSARQFLRLSPTAESTPVERPLYFSHLRRNSERSDASPTLDQLPDSTFVTLENTVVSSQRLPPIIEVHTPSRKKPLARPTQTSVANQPFETPVSEEPPTEFPPPPEDWLSVQPSDDENIFEQTAVNHIYDHVVINQSEASSSENSTRTYTVQTRHPQGTETNTLEDQLLSPSTSYDGTVNRKTVGKYEA